MKSASVLRDRIRAQLADLKMPGALEALDAILAQVDGGHLKAAEAIEALLGAHITLRNNRRLQTAINWPNMPRAWVKQVHGGMVELIDVETENEYGETLDAELREWEVASADGLDLA